MGDAEMAGSFADAAMEGCVFPTDIMLSILTRLPARSIQRFKFVSHRWGELFSHPEFIRMYQGEFSLDPDNQSVLIYLKEANVMNVINKSPKNPSIIGLPLSDRHGNMSFLGYCNGLICMLHTTNDLIVLWNPAMEMFQIVGRYGFCEDHYVFLGLGYDAGGDDFKLVKIVMTTDTGYRTNSMEVYSVNAGAWTEIDINLDFYVEDDSAVTGNPYFLAYVGDVDEYYDVSVAEDPPLANMLVYLDVKLMVFRTLPLPPPYLPDSRKAVLVDWNGSLRYLEYATNDEWTNIVIC